MNAQDLDQKQNRLSYQKDYSKLESIFDEAVERMHRKKIIYYATDRIFSDDSRRFRAKETFKEVAWARPLSSDDVKTEVIQLAKDNVIPISETILNDDVSLRSILELVGEDIPESTATREAAEEIVEEDEESDEPPKLSTLIENEDLKKTEDLAEIEVTKDKPLNLVEEVSEPEPQTEKSEHTLYSWFRKIREDVLSKKNKKTVVKEETPKGDAVLLSNLVLDENEKSEEISDINESDQAVFEEKEPESKDEIFEQVIEVNESLTGKIPEDTTLSELLALIQEDDSYLSPGIKETQDIVIEDVSNLSESEVTEQSVADEFNPKTSDAVGENQEKEELFFKIQDQLDELDKEKNQLNEETTEMLEETEGLNDFNETAEEMTLDLNEQPSEELEENNLEFEERPFDTEITENKPKRRVQIDEIDNQDLFEIKEEDKVVTPEFNQTYIDLVNSARKEYMLSRISFIVALFLTGVFTALSFRSFTGIDYFALILSLIGVILVWDLKSKYITIMGILMEMAIGASMFYLVYSTGMQLDYFHYVWLLVLPLLISASYLFKKSRENYASVIKNKDLNLNVN